MGQQAQYVERDADVPGAPSQQMRLAIDQCIPRQTNVLE